MKRKLIPILGLVLALFGIVQTGHALTLAEIRTAIRRNIRDTATTAALQRYSDSYLTSFVNEGQRVTALKTWPVSKTATISLVSGTSYYTLPTDTMEIQRVTNGYVNLPEVSLAQLDADNNNTDWNTTTGTPAYFFQDRSMPNSIGISPIPTTSGTLRVIYYAYPTTLSADADVPFNGLDRYTGYHDLIVFYVSYRIMIIEAMTDRASLYKQLYEEGVTLMTQNVGARPEKVPAVPQAVNKQ